MQLGYMLLLVCIDPADGYSPATSLSSGSQVQAKADPAAGPYSTAHRLRQLVCTKRKKGRSPFGLTAWLAVEPLLVLLQGFSNAAPFSNDPAAMLG